MSKLDRAMVMVHIPGVLHAPRRRMDNMLPSSEQPYGSSCSSACRAGRTMALRVGVIGTSLRSLVVQSAYGRTFREHRSLPYEKRHGCTLLLPRSRNFGRHGHHCLVMIVEETLSSKVDVQSSAYTIVL